MFKLLRSRKPTTVTPKVQEHLIKEATKEPGVTAKELKASLASVNVRAHYLTIGKGLEGNRIHLRVRGKNLCRTKRTQSLISPLKKNILRTSKTFRKNDVYWQEKKWTFWKDLHLIGSAVNNNICFWLCCRGGWCCRLKGQCQGGGWSRWR